MTLNFHPPRDASPFLKGALALNVSAAPEER